MSSRTFLVLVTLLTTVLFATLGAGFYLWRETQTGGTAAIGGSYTLVDQTGVERTDESWPDQYKLIYFGYTYCPDFCPTTLTVMTGALGELSEDVASQIKPLMITIDPERDTVEALAQYHEHFDPRFSMLTGTLEQVDQAAKAYRVYYAKAESESATEYLVDHSTITYLMGPDGGFVTHFPHDVTPQQMAERLTEVVGG